MVSSNPNETPRDLPAMPDTRTDFDTLTRAVRTIAAAGLTFAEAEECARKFAEQARSLNDSSPPATP